MTSLGHLHSLLHLFLLLGLNHFQELSTIILLDCLQTGIIISELPLTALVQLTKLTRVASLLNGDRSFVLLLSFFKSFLGSDLIKLSRTVLGALLELSKSLDLSLFLFFDADSLTNLGLLALLLSTDVVGNLHIEYFLDLASLLLLCQSVLVGNLNLIVENCNLLTLDLSILSILTFDFLDIGKHGCFLTLEDLLLLGSLLLARLNLIDEDLLAAFAGLLSALLSLKLSLDDLQSLNLHHHVKSLLLLDPVLLKSSVLLDLSVSDGEDLG